MGLKQRKKEKILNTLFKEDSDYGRLARYISIKNKEYDDRFNDQIGKASEELQENVYGLFMAFNLTLDMLINYRMNKNPFWALKENIVRINYQLAMDDKASELAKEFMTDLSLKITSIMDGKYENDYHTLFPSGIIASCSRKRKEVIYD